MNFDEMYCQFKNLVNKVTFCPSFLSELVRESNMMLKPSKIQMAALKMLMDTMKYSTKGGKYTYDTAVGNQTNSSRFGVVLSLRIRNMMCPNCSRQRWPPMKLHVNRNCSRTKHCATFQKITFSWVYAR